MGVGESKADGGRGGMHLQPHCLEGQNGRMVEFKASLGYIQGNYPKKKRMTEASEVMG